MKNINYMMKCRVLFLHSVDIFLSDKVYSGNYIYELLDDFLNEYYFDYYELFDLIYCFKKDENGIISVYEEEKWQEIFLDYLDYLIASEDDFLKQMYRDIKFADIEKISKLVELFYQYIVYNDNGLENNKEDERWKKLQCRS